MRLIVIPKNLYYPKSIKLEYTCWEIKEIPSKTNLV